METRFTLRNFDAPVSLEDYEALPKHPIVLILDNLRSAYNVGSVFRTADAARVQCVAPCGVTAYPPHLKLQKTAVGTERFVCHERFAKTGEAISVFQERGYHTVALETVEGAPVYHAYDFPRPLALVLGNEALGVSEEALAQVESVVQIPLYGYKNSLNVVCALSVVLFEVLRQWKMEGVAPFGLKGKI
ncbi:MAG: hypothetical protein A2293_09745 [Elusimicrobia bacterium RIFOXYB2_FULL_49_7]|nr:MAG: hypothetical protein A2293_09745 [Elusimicrobia bacterium RIFOXYB2_FULL_49_7]